jgi:enamine deaminase RidA (YjgF/YER057c/UK114 family)
MRFLLAVISSVVLGLGTAHAEIVRHSTGDFPIASAIVVPSNATTYYFSGVVPPKLADGSFGKTTEEQTINIFKSIEQQLKQHDLGLGDIVKMQVYLVAPPGSESMDFEGFMNGYKQFFATSEQPNKPVRSTFEVKALALPEWFIEVEVIAAKL